MELFLEKNCPTDSAKWSASKAAAKKKFDVYPSAYANGWAAKNYKSKGGGWKVCKESVIKEEESEMNPKVLDISSEQDKKRKELDIYDEPNYDSTYYYTGMQGKR
jgi:hypothetical protein